MDFFQFHFYNLGLFHMLNKTSLKSYVHKDLIFVNNR